MSKRGGAAGRQETMGYTDKGGSGGYDSENLDEGQAKSCAKNDEWVNTAAGGVSKKDQPNHVGGSRAGV